MHILKRKPLNPPTPHHHQAEGFSQAMLVHGGVRALISSQPGIDAAGELAGPFLGEQTHAALDNIERLLGQLNRDLSRVIILRVYLAESARYDQQVVVDALKQRFPIAPPTITWLIVHGLAEPEWLIAIEAEAALPGFD